MSCCILKPFFINRIYLICFSLAFLLTSGCAQVPDQHHIVASHDASQIVSGSESVCISHPIPAADGASMDAAGFRMMSWNIYKGADDGWQDDLQEMAGESDLLLLQEGSLEEDLLTFFKDNELHWEMAAAFTYQEIPAGVITASKIAPRITCSVRNTEPLIRLPKTTMVTSYPMSGTGDSLLVANIHSINYSLGLGVFKQQLEQVVALLENHQGPIIFAGDFNTWSLGRQELVERMTEDLQLTAVELIDDHRTSRFGRPLDIVFYRGLIVQRAQVLAVDSSDHNPILVSFKVGSDSTRDN